MKLLIITQKVDIDDPILGFFHTWIKEFSKNCESVSVICLEKGKFDLPENVRVFSLGKEDGVSRIKYLYRFYKYIFSLRSQYDFVFVHMNPIYVVLGGLFWRAVYKKNALWYTHKKVNLILRIAEKLTNIVFTASKVSFRLKTDKLQIVGHGIDVNVFTPVQMDMQSRSLIHVGRITPIKHCEVAIEALSKLGSPWRLEFIGEPVLESDKIYKDRLLEQISEFGLGDRVTFIGSLSSTAIHQEMVKAFASVNMPPTGGMDKAVLESLSSGRLAFTSNTAFKEVFGSYSDDLIFQFKNAKDLADKITRLAGTEGSKEIISELSKKVRLYYNVQAIVGRISTIIRGETS